MLKVLFYFGRHNPFFGVLVALVRACDHNNAHLNISGLSLVTFVLAKMFCQVRKVETWKGKEKIIAIEMNWIAVCGCECQICQGSEKDLALELKSVIPPRSVSLWLIPECSRHSMERMSMRSCFLAVAGMHGKDR